MQTSDTAEQFHFQHFITFRNHHLADARQAWRAQRDRNSISFCQIIKNFSRSEKIKVFADKWSMVAKRIADSRKIENRPNIDGLSSDNEGEMPCSGS